MIGRLLGSEMTGNLLWLAVSALLATGVWYIAVTSADPIRQRRFNNISIQFVPSSTGVMTNGAPRSVDVTIQGSQTIVSSRLASDIIVRADLSRLGPGSHSVPLAVEVVKPDTDSFSRLVSRVEPSQISIELEPRESRDIGILVDLVEAPPIGFRNDEPQPDIDQARVSGAASLVSQVVAVRGQLDLSTSRNPLEVNLRLHAIDADGNRIIGVELAPQTASVAVNISRRDDIRQIAVRPNVLLSTLPDGFTLKNQSYEPESLFVSGAPDQLEKISDTLLTAPISLEGREEGFVTNVPVQLPDDELFVMGGDSNITVSIEIIPIVVSRQIDSIEVGHIGLGDGYEVSIVPKTATAIVTGPVVYVDALSLEDILLAVDLDGLAPGVYDLSPAISITKGDLSQANVSLSPAELNVEITSPEATDENESAASADN